MDIRRVDLLLKYILTAAGQEDPGQQELGPIHLIKYVYLADLIFAEKQGGGTYSGAHWRFHHFGPWSPEVYNRIEPVITEVGARVRQIPSSMEEDLIRYSLVDEVSLEGVRWLDSLAGEPVEPQEGEITFSKTIWKS
jgi:hypothetical protein